MPPTQLVWQLTRDEGSMLKVYADSKGIPTIGSGRNLRDKGISDSERLMLLNNDILNNWALALKAWTWFPGLDDARQGVLLNMAMMGFEKLLGFRHMLAAFESRDWETAAAELEASDYFKEVGARAERLKVQILTGEWQ